MSILKITEAEKLSFLEKDTIECRHVHGRVSESTCRSNRLRAVVLGRKSVAPDAMFILACIDCERGIRLTKKVAKRKPKKKTCKLFLEYPGMCSNAERNGVISENLSLGNISASVFKGKKFCCYTCTNRYHHLKATGKYKLDGVLYRWAGEPVKK